MNPRIVELNESNFDQEVLRSEAPVMVQFWAGWSSSCKNMNPLMESIAANRAGEVKVTRVNVEQNEPLADAYGVRAVPTTLIFNRGRLQDRLTGHVSEHEVQDKLRRLSCFDPVFSA